MGWLMRREIGRVLEPRTFLYEEYLKRMSENRYDFGQRFHVTDNVLSSQETCHLKPLPLTAPSFGVLWSKRT
jgi:hypothetical protein